MGKSTTTDNQGENQKENKSILKNELFASEVRYRRLFESARDGILILDAETGKIVDVNPFLIDLLGYSKNEFIEKSIWEIGAFQDSIENKEKFLELQLSEYVRYEDLPLETSGGKQIHVEFVSNVYLVNDKKVIQCHIREITERKSKEDSLKETHRATSDFLNILLNHMHAPIIIWDTVMIIKRFNSKFEHLSGYKSVEVIGKKIDFLFPEDKIETTLELLKNHLDDKLEIAEIDILTKGNTIKTVLWNSSRILDEEGKNIIATISQDITDRKRTEDALNLLETRYRRLFETAKDGILILNADTGKIDDVNPFLIDLLGYSKKEFIEKSIWEIGAFQDIYVNKEKFLELQQKEYIRYDDLPLVTSDGREIHVEFVSNVYLANNNKVIQCNIRDITERTTIQKEIKFQADLINNVGQAVIATDLLGKVIYWNNGAEKIYGWSPAEAIGQNIMDLTPARQSNEQAIEIMKELNAGKTWAGEFYVKRKDESSFPVFLTDTPMLDSNGKLTGIIGISNDITERKLAETELVKLTRAVEQSPVSIIITDLDGNIEYANPKTLEIAGYTKEEMIGKNPRIFSSGEKPKSEYQQLWNTISTGKEWFGEFHNKKKNNELYWESASISPIFNEKQEIINYLAIKEDITERKKFIEDLKIAKDKAEESDRLKSAFLANMSHEIRTPMNGILGFTDLLKNFELKDDVQQEYIRIIEKSGARMLNIINDIISISKIESYEVEIKISEMNVNDQIEKIYRFFRVEAEQKELDISFKNRLSKEDMIIRTDGEKVFSVLTNLANNAIKFTQTGFIELGCLKKDGFLEFYVKDSGPGIPAEQKEIIFERFRQGSEALTRNYEGAGLGLSISKAYIEMLGGRIWAENNADRDLNAAGATFFFTIPFASLQK